MEWSNYSISTDPGHTQQCINLYLAPCYIRNYRFHAHDVRYPTHDCEIFKQSVERCFRMTEWRTGKITREVFPTKKPQINPNLSMGFIWVAVISLLIASKVYLRYFARGMPCQEWPITADKPANQMETLNRGFVWDMERETFTVYIMFSSMMPTGILDLYKIFQARRWFEPSLVNQSSQARHWRHMLNEMRLLYKYAHDTQVRSLLLKGMGQKWTPLWKSGTDNLDRLQVTLTIRGHRFTE